MPLEQMIPAQELERHLGAPDQPQGVLGWQRSLESDEQETHPTAACELLDAWGLQHYYLPPEQGGRLTALEQLAWLLRVVARRDLTVAVCRIITYIGAGPVSLFGNTAQKKHVADLILGGHEMAFALTERSHGSDLLATESVARAGPDGFLLSGEKWLIGNAARCRAMSLFARTVPEGGPGGFNLFLVDKQALPGDSWRRLPAEKTVGLRGMDLSGIRFEQCPLAAEAQIGQLGSGLQIALQSQQIARVMITSLSLGAADTVIRGTERFAQSRQLYGAKLVSLFDVRSKLAVSFAKLLAAESVVSAATRIAHVSPRQLAIASAVAKAFVPPLIDGVIREMTIVLGARAFLRTDPEFGHIQKTARDHAVLGTVESSTAVNLKAIALQLPMLARAARDVRGSAEDRAARTECIYRAESALPDFDPAQLVLLNQSGDEVFQGFPTALDQLRRLKDKQGNSRAIELCFHLAELLHRKLAQDEAMLNDHTDLYRKALDRSPELFSASQRYLAYFAAVACLNAWTSRPNRAPAWLAEGSWLAVGLHTLLDAVGESQPPLPRWCLDNTFDALASLCQSNRMLSAFDFELS